jgi:hypothetical protein
MEQNQAIKKILLETENLQAHFKRLAKPGNQLHTLDIDLMKEKIRGLYEEVIRLYEFTSSERQEIRFIARKDEMQEQHKPLPSPVTIEIHEQPVADQKPKVEHETAIKAVTTPPPAPAEKTSAVFTAPHESESPGKDVQSDTAQPDVRSESPELRSLSDNTKTPVKTTLDLFAHAGIESVASRLGADDDPSVAARMQRSKINDLRSAIGINDKFLFINELFRGNMQQYNKVLDELNDFKSLNGAQTYLMELKVEHQWEAESNAFIRLNSFIERRFGA